MEFVAVAAPTHLKKLYTDWLLYVDWEDLQDDSLAGALDTGANQVTAFLPTAFSPGNFGLCDIIADFVFQCMAHRTDIVVIESAGAYFDVSPLSSRSWRVTSQAEQRRVHFVGSVRPVPLVEALHRTM